MEEKNKSEKMNEDLQVEKIGNDLEGRTIALCVTGGIAAIETPKIARQLRRYGADVNAYATPSALKFVGEASLEWATGKRVVCELSGLAEHICREDLVLVAPATLNTMNKMFYGIADNCVTSLVASALGMKKPVYVAPTMHISLYNNPMFQENLAKADKYGVKIIEPRFGENKAKIARTQKIVTEVLDYFRRENEKNETKP
jgi:phosphopantothenoylcysteine decarboxylase / phosphopantothenate---cysteine ligase